MKTCVKTIVLLALLALTTLNSPLSTLHAQGTVFTYQGRLNDGGVPANSTNYGMVFYLYDAPTGGNQLGNLGIVSVTVSNGLFTVPLNFNNVFDGNPRWLEISVQKNGGGFSTLSPRQALTPTPYAITAGNVVSGGLAAGSYSNAVTLNNAANQFTGTFDGNGSGLVNVNATTFGGLTSSNFWQLGGNTVSAGQFVGSVNNQPVAILANNLQVMQFSYASNSADGYSPNVIGGYSGNNVAGGVVGATIGGGGSATAFNPNSVIADFGTVVGGSSSTAAGKYAIAGGYFATAGGQYSVALGNQPTAIGYASTAMGGGFASGTNSTASGASSAVGDYSTAMGYLSSAYGYASTAMGHSTASGTNSTAFGASSATNKYAFAVGYQSVAGGRFSTAMGNAIASGDWSTAMGFSTASDFASTAMGYFSTASGPEATAMGGSTASGSYSTAMGNSTANGGFSTAIGQSTARGNYSFAAGFGAFANYQGDFVWADSQTTPFNSTANDQFLIRAQGGVGIGLTNPAAALHVASQTVGTPQVQINQQNSSDSVRLRMNSGGNLGWEMDVSPGSTPQLQIWYVGASPARMTIDTSGNVYAASFNPSSDRNLKENFSAVSPQEVLDKVAALPITRWNFKQDKAIEHLGPMAQDFHAAFGLGTDDKHIATVDEEGVALAAIQGLNQKLNEKDAEIQQLKESVAQLRELVSQLANSRPK